MKVIEKKLTELIPYENNPRNNDAAVDAVANSIKEFGFKVPIITDKDGVIVAGHTRKLAAEKLGLKTVPVILADDLTEKQIKAFRLADNKTAELADWIPDKLEEELADLADVDMSQFGFEELEEALNEWFERKNRNDDSRQEGNDEYNEFLDKFEAKKTTDDCYTPDQVYEAVATYVCEKYGGGETRKVRPTILPKRRLSEGKISRWLHRRRQSAIFDIVRDSDVLRRQRDQIFFARSDAYAF